jgi:hypothetical protein
MSSLTDLSCWDQIQEAKRKKQVALAMDARYSSRNKRANEITTVACNANAGTHSHHASPFLYHVFLTTCCYR